MATVNRFPGDTTIATVITNQMSDAYNTFILNPSGGSDDSTALNAVITGAGRRVILGAGTFNLKSTFTLDFNNITVEGSGTGATILNIDDSSGNIGDGILIDKVSNCVVKNLTITASSARASGNGIHVKGGDIADKLDPAYNLANSGFRILDVDMSKQFTGIYVNNDTANYNWRGYIVGGRHSQITALGHGIWIDTSGGSTTTFGASHFIENFWVGQTPNTANAGIRLSGTGDATITNTEIYGATYGILMDPAANGFLTSVTVNGGFIDRSGTACMRIAPNASVARFGEIRFNGVWFAGATAGDAVQITGAAANLILFSNCTFYSAEGSPGWCANINASTNVQFVGGSVAAATTGGIKVTGSASRFRIQGMTFTGTGVGTSGLTTLPTGIQVDAGCDHYTITGNDLSDSGVGSTAKITNTPGTSAALRIVQDNVTS